MANMDSTPPPAARLDTVTATEAKNSFGAVLDRVLVNGSVAITKHDEVRAVLLSVAQYESLLGSRPDPLSGLASEFDPLLQRMQTRKARKAGRALFDASPAKLGRAAAAGRRRG